MAIWGYLGDGLWHLWHWYGIDMALFYPHYQPYTHPDWQSGHVAVAPRPPPTCPEAVALGRGSSAAAGPRGSEFPGPPTPGAQPEGKIDAGMDWKHGIQIFNSSRDVLWALRDWLGNKYRTWLQISPSLRCRLVKNDQKTLGLRSKQRWAQLQNLWVL